MPNVLLDKVQKKRTLDSIPQKASSLIKNSLKSFAKKTLYTSQLTALCNKPFKGLKCVSKM